MSLPTTAARDAARAAHERAPAIVLELDLDTCTLSYGVAPCTAGSPGSPTSCYNTRRTCQDVPNYTLGTKTLKFCSRGMPIPAGETIRPYIVEADPAVTAIDPEKGLARRGTMTLTLIDEPDADTQTDPYVTVRSTPAQGTFWARLIARNPHYVGRFARVRRGYVVSPWNWDTFLTELYVIDQIDGPGRDGTVKITLRDPLKLVDRNKLPAPTDGKLGHDLKAVEWTGTCQGGTTTTVILGGDASSENDAYHGMEVYLTASTGAGQRTICTDYVGETRTATVSPALAVAPAATTTAEVGRLSLTLDSGKGSQYADPATSGKREFVRVGEEIIEYTAKSGDTLSWPTTAYRAQFGTSRADHRSGGGVQLCRAFVSTPVTDVVKAILTESGLDVSYVDTTALAAAEVDWYGDQYRITACLSEPTSGTDYLDELLPQIGAVAWWSPQQQKAQFVVVLAKQSAPTAWTDAANLLEHSVDVETLDNLRITLAALNYGLRSATANRNQATSFLRAEVAIDTAAESAPEYDGRRADIADSRWFGPENQPAARAYVARKLAKLRDAPRRIKLRLDPKDYILGAGEQVDIQTRQLTDFAGAPATTRVLITKTDDRGGRIDVEGRTLPTRRYAYIAPNGTADYPTDTTYAHITDANGKMGNGDDGYYII